GARAPRGGAGGGARRGARGGPPAPPPPISTAGVGRDGDAGSAEAIASAPPGAIVGLPAARATRAAAGTTSRTTTIIRLAAPRPGRPGGSNKDGRSLPAHRVPSRGSLFGRARRDRPRPRRLLLAERRVAEGEGRARRRLQEVPDRPRWDGLLLRGHARRGAQPAGQRPRLRRRPPRLLQGPRRARPLPGSPSPQAVHRRAAGELEEGARLRLDG